MDERRIHGSAFEVSVRGALNVECWMLDVHVCSALYLSVAAWLIPCQVTVSSTVLGVLGGWFSPYSVTCQRYPERVRLSVSPMVAVPSMMRRLWGYWQRLPSGAVRSERTVKALVARS